MRYFVKSSAFFLDFINADFLRSIMITYVVF